MILNTKPIFKNREYLRPTYVPDRLPHRDKEIQRLARIMAAPLRGETPSNVLVYGKPGTGKTATVRHVLRELEQATLRSDSRVKPVYINCEITNTSYRLLAKLAEVFLEELKAEKGKELMRAMGLPERIPKTGWPLDEVYRNFIKAFDHSKQFCVIVLDEIDKLVRRSGDEVLYMLTRVNTDLVKAKVSIIGISNDLNFMEYLDVRVRSSLGQEEIVFPPYNAGQLRDILSERARMSFVDGAVEAAVISLCAAYAAREHGDARRALDLLRTAGEIAEAEGAEKVQVEHVRKARDQIETDQTIEVIRTLPFQSKIVLYAVAILAQRFPRALSSGEVYEFYQQICRQMGENPLTRRRVGDLVSELDMLGIISAKIVNRGRYGRTKEIRLDIDPLQVYSAIQEDYRFEPLVAQLLSIHR
jgi:cell division control protein 6